jgi:hypothetical protein
VPAPTVEPAMSATAPRTLPTEAELPPPCSGCTGWVEATGGATRVAPSGGCRQRRRRGLGTQCRWS